MVKNNEKLIEQNFNREDSLYLVCNAKRAFFTSEKPIRFKLWSCQKVCAALHYLLDSILRIVYSLGLECK